MSSSFQSQPQQSCFRLQYPFPVYALYPVPPSQPPYYIMTTMPHVNRRPRGPARPPNAWILYRQWKVHQLPALPPGAPRRSQGEISKLLSKQWKVECDEIKTRFERLAEKAKQEHALLYPDYKFNPESKAEKAKRKREEAAQKELRRAHSKRARSSRGSKIAAAVPPPYLATGYSYDPAAMYGDAGPSPHLSAASSPISSKSTSLPPLPPVNDRSRYPDNHTPSSSSPASDAYRNSFHSGSRSPISPDVYNSAMPPPATPNGAHPDMIRQHLSHPAQYQTPSQPQEQQMGFVGELTPWMHNPSYSNQISIGTEDSSSYQNQWMIPSPAETQGIQQATAFATSDPSIFSLQGGQEFSAFLESGQGELEVALAPQPSHAADPQTAAQFAYFASLFDSIDYPLEETSSQQTANVGGSMSSRVMSPVEASPAMSFYNNGFEQHVPMTDVQHQGIMTPVTPSQFMNNMVQSSRSSSGAPSPTAPQQQLIPSFGQEAFQQYFNFDIPGDMGSMDASPTSPRSTSSHSQSMPVMDHNLQRTSPTQQVPYMPPAGAAHAGTRRVAGSWRPPHPEADEPSGTWTYPVQTQT